MSYQNLSFPKRALTFLFEIVVFILIFAVLPSFGQDDKKKAEELKKQEKAVKSAENVAKRQDKIEGRYRKIRDFAQNAYDTDADFKEAVNRRYGDVLQGHTRFAYLVNTRMSNASLVRQTGDNLTFDNILYANPLAQDFVNRVGQSVIPKDSKQLYSFKIIQNPVPEAKALSTGTVYITTGYLSIVDNEAQLAYILAHEISHIEKQHWFQDVIVELGAEPYAKKNPWKMIWWSIKDAKDTLLDPISVILAAKINSMSAVLGWENFQEDEADRDALKWISERNYDVREVPKLYDRMQKITSDPRSQTGFIASSDRIKDRSANINAILSPFIKGDSSSGAVNLADNRGQVVPKTGTRGLARILGESMAPDIRKKLESGELIASSEEFQSTMALVKRDNGLRALQFDMFELARANLQDSLAIRSNDPYAFYYYGKALKTTARNASDMSAALQNLNQSITADQRQTIAEPYLFRAMLRLGERNPTEAPKIANDLRKYVEIYQRENTGALPPNMEFVYDFMQDLEVLDYRATPAANTKEAERMNLGSQPPTGQPMAPAAVVSGPSLPQPKTPAKTVKKP